MTMENSIIFNNMSKGPSAIIKVIGVGGGGCNAVNHMFNQGIIGVDFMVCNTDAQALAISPVNNQLQLGPELTAGRGAGAKPEVGKDATIESLDEIKKIIGNDTQMLFITAGMGGGTGTGGAPVIAKAAKELNVLTVGIVTTPFTYEGKVRKEYARNGIKEMRQYVDTLIVISNDKVNELYSGNTLKEALSKADDVLVTAAKGISEIITVPGLINVDFADVNTVMREGGVAIMGSATATGEDRAKRAVTEALSSPLLNDNKIIGANHVLINISYGSHEVLMQEIDVISNYVRDEATNNPNIILGVCPDERLEEAISVTILATGFETDQDSLLPEGYASGGEVQKAYVPYKPVVAPPNPVRPVVEPVQQPVQPTNRPTQVPAPSNIYGNQHQTQNHIQTLETDHQVNPVYNVDQTPKPQKLELDPKDLVQPIAVDMNNGRERQDGDFEIENMGNSTDDTGITNKEDESFRKSLKRSRQERLKKLYRSTSDINERESQPAYRRKEMNFEDVEDSEQRSKMVLTLDQNSKDGNPKLKKGGNPLLHDNID